MCEYMSPFAPRSKDMQDSNPYQLPKDRSRNGSANAKPFSRRRWALLGFLIGAIYPIGCGIYGICQFRLYVATLPQGMPVCGMPVLGAYAMILVVGPVFGLIGAALGYATAILVGNRRTPL